MRVYVAEHDEARITVKLTLADRRQLDQEAKRRSVSISEIVRERCGFQQPVRP